MAKFNIKPVTQKKATNLAGGTAFAESPELEFASLLLTSFVQDQFYRTESDMLERVSELLDNGVPPAGLDKEKSLRCIEMFASEVMPNFADDLIMATD